jgi:hypothetical protein
MTRVLMLFAVALSLGGTSGSLRADPALLAQVATCTGRLSAYLERHWAGDLQGAERVAALHAHMTDLMFALVSSDSEDRVSRDQRTDAKLSFRALLARSPSDYSSPRAAQMAQRKIEQDLRSCAALAVPRDRIDHVLGLEEGLRLSHWSVHGARRTAGLTLSK